MRILHTSDWHLGRSFHREGLLGAQAAYIDHLVETVLSERVDAVVISGDVYDRALPPVDAVALANDALRRLVSARVRVIITSGNHDSAQRLGFASELIDASGVHLRTQPAGVGRPVCFQDEHGEVAVYGLPYLEPDLVREPWSLAERSHHAALAEAMARVRADLQGRPGTRSVVMAHAFVTGGAASESERDISVGGVSNVSKSIFDGIDYVALGHLHGRQTLAEGVRYSGSPLAYSFSEARQHKGSWLVELDAAGLAAVEFVAAPVPRRLSVLRGSIDELLTADRPRSVEGDWLQITLTDAIRPRGAMERLRDRFPHTLVLRFEPETNGSTTRQSQQSRVLGLSDQEVIANFFADVRGGCGPSDEETELITCACEQVRIQPELAS